MRFLRPVFPKQQKHLRPKLARWAENGWLNVVGGCCGTTPEHIRVIVNAVQRLVAARIKLLGVRVRHANANEWQLTQMILRISGLEPLNITPEFGFVVVGERTNITGSPKFSKLILAGDFEGALAVARQQVQGGANLLDVNMDEGMIDSEAAMIRFLNLIGSEPEIARIPDRDRQLKVERHRSWTQMLAGKSRRELHQPEKRRRGISPAGAIDQAIWRGHDRDGIR